MNLISERNIKEDEVIEKSRIMLTSVFDELTTNQEGIGQSLKDGLRTDKIVGTCQKCKSDLIIRRGHRGTRFIGCSGYPECRFTLPLPRFGTVVVTDKKCEEHGMLHIRIINKGKRPWDLGCPHCNFLEWQAKKAQEKADPAKAKENAKPRAAKATGPAKAGKKAKPLVQAKGDGLVALSGIGPKTLEKLTGAGIKTAADLAQARADSLAKMTGISAKKILAWQEAARAMS
jgi:DNA topoisomerase-1